MPYKDKALNERGYRHTDTSHDALPGKVDADTLRYFIRGALCIRPMTADECARFIQRDRLSVRPRFTELKTAGVIYDTGERRENESGRRAAVFALMA